MRWQRLFAELEHELAVAEHDDGDREVEREERRLRSARTTLRERLTWLGRSGEDVALQSAAGEHRMTLDAVGVDWLSGRSRDGRQSLLRIAAIDALVAVGPIAERAAAAEDPIPESAAVTLAMVLRDLARRRVPLTLTTTAGSWHGTLAGAWADHGELAVHAHGEPCRRSAVRQYRTVPLDVIIAVTLEAQGG